MEKAFRVQSLLFIDDSAIEGDILLVVLIVIMDGSELLEVEVSGP